MSRYVIRERMRWGKPEYIAEYQGGGFDLAAMIAEDETAENRERLASYIADKERDALEGELAAAMNKPIVFTATEASMDVTWNDLPDEPVVIPAK